MSDVTPIAFESFNHQVLLDIEESAESSFAPRTVRDRVQKVLIPVGSDNLNESHCQDVASEILRNAQLLRLRAGS